MKGGSILLVLCVCAAATQAFGQPRNQDNNDWFSTDCSEDIARGEEFGITAIPDTVPEAYK